MFEKDITRFYLPISNTYTYRIPSYMLSTVQDYRKGYGGFQQLAWQASIGPSALVFTSNSARERKGNSPDFWTGSGVQPRCAQYENVCICHYQIKRFPSLMVRGNKFETRASFPKNEIDEVHEEGGWVFG